VPVDQLLSDRFELAQKFDVARVLGHRSSEYLYRVVAPIYLCLAVTFKFLVVIGGARAPVGRYIRR
jgi:hypothetical protein